MYGDCHEIRALTHRRSLGTVQRNAYNSTGPSEAELGAQAELRVHGFAFEGFSLCLLVKGSSLGGLP